MNRTCRFFNVYPTKFTFDERRAGGSVTTFKRAAVSGCRYLFGRVRGASSQTLYCIHSPIAGKRRRRSAASVVDRTLDIFSFFQLRPVRSERIQAVVERACGSCRRKKKKSVTSLKSERCAIRVPRKCSVAAGPCDDGPSRSRMMDDGPASAARAESISTPQPSRMPCPGRTVRKPFAVYK